MQVQVTLQVMTPDGTPVLGVHRIECVMVTDPDDHEGTLLKCAARLEDLLTEGQKTVQRQVRTLREAAR